MKMILRTRYRDIPFDDVFKCAKPGVHDPAVSRSFWENTLRGKPVTVETPPLDNQTEFVVCKGPFYRIWPREYSKGREQMVCVHMVEIGD